MNWASFGAVFLISLTFNSSANAEELNGSYLGGFGDLIFSFIESDAERSARERESIVSKFAGDDGVLSADESNALQSYDNEQMQNDSEQAIEDMNALMGSMIATGDKINSKIEEDVNSQVYELDAAIEEVKAKIASRDSLSAKIAVEKIGWIPIGKQELDDRYTLRYRSIKQLLEEEIKKIN